MLLGASGGRVKWDVDDEFQDRRRKDCTMPMSRGVRGAALLLSIAMGSAMVGCGGGSDSAVPIDTGNNPPNNPPPGVITPPPPPAVQGNVIFTRSTAGNEDLHLIKSDGSGLVTLAADATKKESWSRVVGNRALYHKGPVGFGARDIWGVNLDGSANTAIASTPADEFVRAVIGNVVVYEVTESLGGQRDLWVVNLDGTGAKAIANNVNDDEIYAATAGGRILYEQRSGGKSNVFSVLPDGSDLQSIGVTADDEFVVGVIGTKVVMERRADNQAPADLYTVEANGQGGPVPIATGPENEVFAGVLGSRILFQRCVSNGGQCDIYAVNADGSSPLVLASSGDNEFVAGTVGNRVLFTRDAGGQTDVYSVDIGGGTPAPLATSGVYSEYAEGVVGTRVVFRREIGNQADLFSINADGSGSETQLAASDRREFFVGAIGNRVIFERLSGASFSSPSDIVSRPVDGSAAETVLAVTADDEEYQGESGGRVIYERKAAGAARDLFSIQPDGSGGSIPLGQTPNDESFVTSF